MNLADIGFNLFKNHIGKDAEPVIIQSVEEALRHHGKNEDGRGGRTKVARFGWSYTEKKTWVADLPEWLTSLDPLGEIRSDNITINQYLPGSSIAPHTDAPWFGDFIHILSLGQPCEMVLQKLPSSTYRLTIPPRSLIVMHREVRWEWKHSVTMDKKAGGPRYSIVFRRRKY